MVVDVDDGRVAGLDRLPADRGANIPGQRRVGETARVVAIVAEKVERARVGQHDGDFAVCRGVGVPHCQRDGFGALAFGQMMGAQARGDGGGDAQAMNHFFSSSRRQNSASIFWMLSPRCGARGLWRQPFR